MEPPPVNPATSPIRDAIRNAAAAHDTGRLTEVIGNAISATGRRSRKDRIHEINAAILESAIEHDNPGLISLLQDVTHENFSLLFPALINQYVRTRNDAWFLATTTIIEGLEKKGDQSEILAHLCQLLIDAGSSLPDSRLIDKGMDLFSRITFRKYRSDILSQISPVLIDWAVSRKDLDSLRNLYTMTGEIADVSKKSIAHARIATAIATLGIDRNEMAVWAEGIRTAADIRQKTRRQACFHEIVQAAASSPLYGKLRDIPATAGLLSRLEPDILHEVVASLLLQVMAHETDRPAVAAMVRSLAKALPATVPTIIASLLAQSDQSGDPWFFSQAMDLQGQVETGGRYPVREFVKAALSIVRVTGSTGILQQVVPTVVSSCKPAAASRILLQIVRVLLAKGELSEALSVFVQVGDDGEKIPQYDESITDLWKYAIVMDRVSEVRVALVRQPDNRQWNGAIYRAVADICRQHAFPEIAEHVDPLAAVMALHPQHDQLVLDSITMLIHRGFLETSDPDVLIRLTRSIRDSGIREQALSTIIIRLAKLGVETRSRDFLQRAVGLSCLIEDEKTRSLTLTAVIDEATVLAVADGDLGLLRRMLEWSASLLSREGEITAIAKIIESMITYAGDRRHPAALDEAYRIAAGIADPSLKKDLAERISENYVRIGCLLVQDLHDPPEYSDFLFTFRLFQQGLAILSGINPQEDSSLKVAHIIDIILDSSRERFRIDLVLPLTLFVLEIREDYERDAMVARIAPMIRLLADQTDSTDPYESITEVLLRIRYVPKDPDFLDLVLRMAGQIKDPFTRFLQFLQLGELYFRTGRQDKTLALLDTICSSLSLVNGEYRRVILLADAALGYAPFAEESARRAVREAADILRTTEYDPDAAACRHLIGAMARLNATRQDPRLIAAAQEITARIREPADFVAVMLPVYQMASGNPALRHEIGTRIRNACLAVSAPVQRAPLILDLAGLMINDREHRAAADLLLEATATARSIQIPFLADVVRNRVATAYVQIGTLLRNDTCFEKANAVSSEIGHEDMRIPAPGPDRKPGADNPLLYHKVRELAERIVTEHFSPAQVNGLENLIRTEPDRGIVARYFCLAAILFNSTGKTRLARKFYDTALGEAEVIRPLSRRTYVLCDLALVLDRAGCGTKAQEIMGHAVNAATGIRQFSDRDEVFENLSAAVRYMQEKQAA